MRSIIFTSVALSVTAGPVLADQLLSCYARSYSDTHLARNSQQVVKGMVVAFYEQSGDTLAFALARLSRQGRASDSAVAGQIFDQYLYCFDGDGAVGTRCSVECDGGGFDVTDRASDSITLRTDYMIMGEESAGCGGAFDIVESVGTPVSYRLNRVDPAVCEAMIP